jgi:hypothetical protein
MTTHNVLLQHLCPCDACVTQQGEYFAKLLKLRIADRKASMRYHAGSAGSDVMRVLRGEHGGTSGYGLTLLGDRIYRAYQDACNKGTIFGQQP